MFELRSESELRGNPAKALQREDEAHAEALAQEGALTGLEDGHCD